MEATGELVSGQQFEGSDELIGILDTKKRDLYYKCLAHKLLTYALGRGLVYYDRCAVDEIQGKLGKDSRFNTLVMAIVESIPFQKRRAMDMSSQIEASGSPCHHFEPERS
ncbi:DUF1585 domain-containing protein [bacterium]|nr:DUF1585 domain-containing protein [Verrucomicrobiales bacterium]MDB2346286.1 DUF1585 domain-containing protein [Verrucomicrobiales bacterium]MDB4789473.1 DUF1585 domain-containing protein [Verrucomicrobiales bacterium]MDC3255185.1 DUF1585 domain-containing protein [bacterium]MDF1788415.1 DUF1585 domain-containing protein [Verrucomicrobiales bacterium]